MSRLKNGLRAAAAAGAGLLLWAPQSATAAVGGGNVSIGWSIPNAPSSGFGNITFPMTVNPATAHNHGIYFAQQFSFQGGRGGYTGLQPRPNKDGKERLRGVFSLFGDGASPQHPNCSGGADGGSGVSCGVEFDAVYGHKYNLKVERVGTDLWKGTATDTVTGAATVIGQYKVPAGSGGLKGSQGGFVEYYLGIGSCSTMPRSDAVFGGPTSTDAGGRTGTSKANYEYSNCVGQANYQAEQVGSGTHVTRGFVTGTSSTLVSKGSGKCLDHLNGSGNAAGLWTCNGGGNQQWTATSSSQLFVNGKCLDAANHGTSPGTKVALWDCNGGANQKWTFGTDGSVRGTESGLCLGVKGASTANGVEVELQTCGGGSSQKWTRG
ncbi:RICIN domain-containing protein [Streptomyces lichenis]|uniref:Ricin-type beta-trefoil lectin domain protein n=1 Tax=Streptomyces lichenis TaxID=2306967 RepID=A0ABT0I6L5_9ACTN|nr:ricin-type beta-trefoil lectin domain protein [Streptomyces lichenis]MCK8676972.1 ricin-type beta-trefoil lectin domain protein [Streptomyces lichenis]